MLTMEQTFVVTGIMILLIAIPLGILIERAFKKENEKEETDNGK